jgi:hypothetical protein
MRDAETTRPRNPQAPSSTKSRGLRQNPFWPRPTSLAARWSPIGGFGSERWGRAPDGGLRSEACSEKGASEAVSFVPKVKYLTLACYGFSYGGRSPIITGATHAWLSPIERTSDQTTTMAVRVELRTDRAAPLERARGCSRSAQPEIAP